MKAIKVSLSMVLLLSAVHHPCSAQEGPLLRIENDGTLDIENLRIGFPDGWVEFGDLSPGELTDYMEVPRGVYGSAAYGFEWQGEMVVQPVADWMGERPLEGQRFTYGLQLQIFPSEPPRPWLRLVRLSTDE